MVLSHFQTSALLTAYSQGKPSVVSSTDLGATASEIRLGQNGAVTEDGTILSWDLIRRINGDATACFFIEKNIVRPIKGYSELFGRSYSLFPTESAPAMIVAGFPMHRVKNITPIDAAKLMIETMGSAFGLVLDTATGLGYTALLAARTADKVITVELDPEALEIARQNPWSQHLFNNQKIDQRMGNCEDIILKFDSNIFSCILHDPPALSLAGNLYSQEFYRQLFRVLKLRGRLFHYIGDPKTKSGDRVTRGVMRRLHDAGFRQVARRPSAFGVVALK